MNSYIWVVSNRKSIISNLASQIRNDAYAYMDMDKDICIRMQKAIGAK